MLKSVILARKVNAVCGFGAVTPMDVNDLDEEWIDLFDGLYEVENDKASEKAQLNKSKENFEKVLAKRRAENKSYRKY